jgi:hypothetical protein
MLASFDEVANLTGFSAQTLAFRFKIKLSSKLEELGEKMKLVESFLFPEFGNQLKVSLTLGKIVIDKVIVEFDDSNHLIVCWPYEVPFWSKLIVFSDVCSG